MWGNRRTRSARPRNDGDLLKGHRDDWSSGELYRLRRGYMRRTMVDQTPKGGTTVPTSQAIDLGAVLDQEYQGR